jgi:hypothetical protein
VLDATIILEQIGAVVRLQEQLSTLSKSNPALAWLIVLVLSILIASVAITQFLGFLEKFGRHKQSGFAWAGLAFGFCAAGLLSWGIVLNLQQSSGAVPELNLKEDTVIGRPLFLKWKYEGKEKNPRFEIQSSKAADFGVADHVSSFGLWY